MNLSDAKLSDKLSVLRWYSENMFSDVGNLELLDNWWIIINTIQNSRDSKGILNYKAEGSKLTLDLVLEISIIRVFKIWILNLPGTDVDRDCFKPSNDCLKTVSIENSSLQFSQIFVIQFKMKILARPKSLKHTVSVERMIRSRGVSESYTQLMNCSLAPL